MHGGVPADTDEDHIACETNKQIAKQIARPFIPPFTRGRRIRRRTEKRGRGQREERGKGVEKRILTTRVAGSSSALQ